MELYNSSKYMRYLIHLFHDGPFRRFDRVHMEGLRTILADTKFAQIIERIEFCEVLPEERAMTANTHYPNDGAPSMNRSF